MTRREILNLGQLFIPTDELGNRPRQICRRQTRLRLRRGRDGCIPVSPTNRVITDFPDELIATARDSTDQIAVRSKGGSQG